MNSVHPLNENLSPVPEPETETDNLLEDTVQPIPIRETQKSYRETRELIRKKRIWQRIFLLGLSLSALFALKYQEITNFVHGVLHPLKETAAVPTHVFDYSPDDRQALNDLRDTEQAPVINESPTPSYTPTPHVNVTPEAVTKEAFDMVTPTEIKTNYELKSTIENFHVVPVPRDIIISFEGDKLIYKVRAKDWLSKDQDVKDAGEYLQLYPDDPNLPLNSLDTVDPSYSIGRYNEDDGYYYHIFSTTAKRTEDGKYTRYEVVGYNILNTSRDSFLFDKIKGKFQGIDLRKKGTRQEVVRDDPSENYQLIKWVFFKPIDTYTPTPNVTPQDQSRNDLNNFRQSLRARDQRRTGSGIF